VCVPNLNMMGGDVADALERVNVPSYVLDRAGVIRWINPAAKRLVGDVVGRQFTSVVTPAGRRRSQEMFAQKVLGTASVTDAGLVLLDAAGEPAAVEITSVPLLRGGRVVGVFGQARNVPEVHLPPPAQAALTRRQTEVLRLLEAGRSTRQIAEELHLSRETVRNHVRHVLQALGVHSRLEAVALARREP
jgi:PAS domain S-box-containing protein